MINIGSIIGFILLAVFIGWIMLFLLGLALEIYNVSREGKWFEDKKESKDK